MFKNSSKKSFYRIMKSYIMIAKYTKISQNIKKQKLVEHRKKKRENV